MCACYGPEYEAIMRAGHTEEQNPAPILELDENGSDPAVHVVHVRVA